MEGASSEDNIQEETNDLQSSAKTVEIKIKTLDSQVYTCHVEETISVPALKEQIAILTGVPAENQRLICRGKVLKDEHILSAYNVEDGHTLHLVTRQVPQPGAPSSSGGTSSGTADGEQQASGPADSPPAVSRNRSGQVSHSVVLGTFNIPDPGDGVVPDVGRIITSMLTSLGITNLVPTNANASNSVSIGGTIIPATMRPPAVNSQERPAGAGGGRSQVGHEGHHSSPTEQGGSQNVGPQNDALQSLWPTGGAMPGSGQHIRLMQQAMVVPDALTTMSQYLNRLEQVFAINGQQQGQVPGAAASVPNSGIQSSSSFVSQPVTSQAALTGHPTAANLGAIIHRTIGLLSTSAGTELARLASQLENEPNLSDAVARGDLQSLALRSGVLMQHLGALLLELGRSTLTLRMGSSPVESAVNAGPALFISPAGPNPMMVQPLPFHPGAGFGTLTGVAQQNIGAVSPSLGSHEVPRNINIHIHASDSGLTSGVPSPFPIPSQVPVRVQTDASNDRVSSSLQASSITTSLAAGNDRASIPTQAPTTSALNQTASGSTAVSLPSAGFPAANEQAGARMMPMRTVVAAIPASLHNRPPTETTGNAFSAFYPLLARFQQLNSSHVAQQGSVSQAAPSNRVPPSLAVVQPGAAPIQQAINPAFLPTQAQVQVQAWIPSSSQTAQGEGELRPMNQEGPLQIPVTSSSLENCLMDSQQQQSLNVTDSLRNRQSPMSRSAFVPFTRSTNTVTADGVAVPADVQQALVQNETAPLVDGISVIEKDVHQGHVNELELQPHNQAELQREGDEIHAAALPSGENNARATSGPGRADSKRKVKSKELHSVPAGLGLGGLQPLPPRMPKRSNTQHRRQQAVQNAGASSGHQGDNSVETEVTLKNSFQGFVSSTAPRSEEGSADGSAQISAGTSQLGNGGRSQGGSRSNRDIGNVISHVMANLSGGNSSVTPMARDNNQGLATSSRALGGVLGQLMQNPLFRNVVRQVADQVREEPQSFEEIISQGSLNFAGVLQQMMPIVSQAFGRVSATSSEQGSGMSRENGGVGNIHGSEQIREAASTLEDVFQQGGFSGVLQQVMPTVSQTLGRVSASSSEGFRENVGGREDAGISDTEQVRETSSMIEDVLSQRGDGQGSLNLSAILQQMMPVVAQAVGQVTEGSSEQAASLLHDPDGVGLVKVQERWGHPQNQDKSPRQSQTTSAKQQQSTSQIQLPLNEIQSGGAPVAKRQKIDLERAVRTLEQDKSPQEIFQVIAEFATMLMAPNDGPGIDGFSLAEQLSQDDSLVNDYISLLSRDFINHTSEDPVVKDSHAHE